MQLPREYKDRLILQFQTMGKHLRETCELCKGEGAIPSNAFGVATRCPACMGKFDELKKFVYSGLSPEYLKFELDTSDYTKDTKVKLEKIINGYPHYMGQINFIFHKIKYNPSAFTVAGVLFLKKFIEAGYLCFYVDFSTLFDFFLNFKDEDSNFKNAMVKYCTQVPVLFIDNFCNNFFKMETREGYLFQNLEKLLRMRINTGLTILSTSLPSQELNTNFKILSPVLNGHFQPIELYSDMNKGKFSENIKNTTIPEDLKKLFNKELSKTKQDVKVPEVIGKSPRKSSLDDVNRG